MRIALVIFHADPARGGAERYTVDLAEALQARGHDVAVIASSFAAGQNAYSKVLLTPGIGTRLGRYRRFVDRLDRHLLAERYDIVHAMLPVRRCDVYHPHAGIAADALSSGHLKHAGPARRLLSQWANRVNLKRRFGAAVERELLMGNRPPVVLCLSQYVKQRLLAHYPINASRLPILFNATDLTRFDPALRPEAGQDVRARFGIAADRVVALMIAQDFQRKGLAEAIEAIACVKDDRLALLVVGKQDCAPYRKLAERLGVARQVVFAGMTNDPYAFYRAADAFVLPTRHDPCSLVVLEALAMGVPVISTVFNGACEIMEDGRHGAVLSDPADFPALAGALRRILDPAVRQAMAASCLALRPLLAYDRHLDNLLAVYETARQDGK